MTDVNIVGAKGKDVGKFSTMREQDKYNVDMNNAV